MKKKIDIKTLVLCGVLIAMHIILSRFLSINAWNTKIGFAFIAVFVAAYVYGPVAGAVVGALGDFLGAILFPIGPYFPGFTLNCALTGLVFGLLLYKKQNIKRILAAVAINELGISLFITPIWIAILYGSPYWPLIVSRIPQIAILLVVEFIAIFYLSKLFKRINVIGMMKGNKPSEIQEKRKNIRYAGISARNALSVEDREKKSADIVSNLVETDEYKNAHTIMIYKATKGEVRLEALEEYNAKNNSEKVFLYPLCITNTEMIPLLPENQAAWQEGYKGIWEPIREKSVEYDPKDIDLIICPCSTFDEKLGRMGMGAGFYDRFIEKAPNAKLVAVAFECQKSEVLVLQEWDKPMQAVVTEERVYRG